MPAIQSPLRGIALMVLAVCIFALMDALVKLMAQTYHPFQVAFFRGVFAIVPAAFMVATRGGLALLVTRQPLAHVLRSIIGVLSLLMFFYAFGHMKLADVVAVGFSAPLFVTALSVPFLGEQVGWRRWSAVIVGFLGVMLVVDPGAGVMDPVAALVALGASLLSAFALIVVRKLSATESNAAIVLYFSISAAVVCGALMPFLWITPSPAHFFMLAFVGILGGSAQYVMVEAFRWAPVSVLVPFEYTAIFWSLAFGYFGFGETASVEMLTGVAIIATSGLYILHRETRKARPQPA